MIRDAKRRLSLPVDDSASASHAAQINYAGCIVSFLGAVHWGLALGDGKLAALRYTYSVIPSVMAWFSLVSTRSSEQRIAQGDAMMSLLIGAYGVDAIMSMNALLPRWYMSLRTVRIEEH